MAMPAMPPAMESGAIQRYVASALLWVPPVAGGTIDRADPAAMLWP
jgi:hypothetical protein